MSISKKIRFEVFKRDGFACGYCGKTPPEVTLEVDHIIPKSKEGIDDIQNLLTACFDCNRGKKDIPLDKAPTPLVENLEILKEKEFQIHEYERFIKKIKRRENKQIEEISNIYTSHFCDWILSEKFKKVSIKTFIQKLPFERVKEFMEIACSRMDDKDRAVKYFCGMCWKRIKGEING